MEYVFKFLFPRKGIYWYSFDPVSEVITIFDDNQKIIHTEKLKRKQ